MRIVKRVYGVEIDLDTLALDDKKTFELLSRGDTTGYFSLNLQACSGTLKNLSQLNLAILLRCVRCIARVRLRQALSMLS